MKTFRTPLAAALLASSVFLSGCTGGQETTAGETESPGKNPPDAQASAPSVDVRGQLKTISPAIPIYGGADYREDLTRRDEVMIRNQFGPGTEVYTLATNDSFPQVWHYYVTYLAQYRSFSPPKAYPPENQNWRTIQVNLNAAMQQPFIPTDKLEGKNVILQVAETEAEPSTVIRYIVSPNALAAPEVAMQ